MQFAAFIEWGFLGLLSFSCLGLVAVGVKINQQLADMNVSLAVWIVELKQAKADLEDHETRIRNIEIKKG